MHTRLVSRRCDGRDDHVPEPDSERSRSTSSRSRIWGWRYRYLSGMAPSRFGCPTSRPSISSTHDFDEEERSIEIFQPTDRRSPQGTTSGTFPYAVRPVPPYGPGGFSRSSISLRRTYRLISDLIDSLAREGGGPRPPRPLLHCAPPHVQVRLLRSPTRGCDRTRPFRGRRKTRNDAVVFLLEGKNEGRGRRRNAPRLIHTKLTPWRTWTKRTSERKRRCSRSSDRSAAMHATCGVSARAALPRPAMRVRRQTTLRCANGTFRSERVRAWSERGRTNGSDEQFG